MKSKPFGDICGGRADFLLLFCSGEVCDGNNGKHPSCGETPVSDK